MTSQQTFLLGAGASAEAGVPLSRELTRHVIESVRGDDVKSLLHFVLGGIRFQRGRMAMDPDGTIDIEELYETVVRLADRESSPLAPFVSGWNARIDAFDEVKDPFSSEFFVQSDLEREIDAFVASLENSNSRARGRSLAESIVKVVSKMSPRRLDVGASFRFAAEELVRLVRDACKVDDEAKVAYLRPLASLAERTGRTTVATLNFDRTVEFMAEKQGIACTTGIDEWARTGRLPEQYEGLILLKLHGSLDWTEDRTRRSATPDLLRSTIRPGEPGYYESAALVFGQSNKLRPDGPFLDLLIAFRDALRQSDVLNIIGYSFRDDHINFQIGRWLTEDQNRRLRIVDPAFEASEVRFAEALRALGESRVESIAASASAGLDALMSES